MLCGLHDSHPVRYRSKTGPMSLGANEKHVLTNQENFFKLGRLEFNLVYENKDGEAHDQYIQIRNRTLQATGRTPPHRCLRALPRHGNVNMVGTAILHDTMSAGTFGVINAAVDAHSGEPLAVKEIVLKDKNMANAVEYLNELAVATSFPVSIQTACFLIISEPNVYGQGM